jgi:Cu/Ag efflux protein CusF
MKTVKMPVTRMGVASAMFAFASAVAFAQGQGDAPAAATAETQAQTATSADQVAKLDVDQQVRWLQHAQKSGALAQMDDAQLTTLFQSLDPLVVPTLIKLGPSGYPSYEFELSRWERINGKWPAKPAHMLVKLEHDPLRIYAKWLPDGDHSGEEVIYDSTKRTDEMYGHLGGLLGMMPMWTALDGTLARSQSNHKITDLGTEFIVSQFMTDAKKYVEVGASYKPQVEVKTIDGVRVVALTYVSPSGKPQFYAKKQTLGLDLRHPYFRTVEAYDDEGQIFEKIVIDRITPKSFDAEAFDPKNPDYKF